MALILDTGPLYASLDRSDADHAACRSLIETADEPLLIPSPVLVEVDYWIHVRLHAGVLVALLDDIVRGAYLVEDLRTEDYRRACELCDRYGDQDLGFVDASVLAVVERLDEKKLATLDERHFRAVRPRHGDGLRLLPMDGQAGRHDSLLEHLPSRSPRALERGPPPVCGLHDRVDFEPKHLAGRHLPGVEVLPQARVPSTTRRLQRSEPGDRNLHLRAHELLKRLRHPGAAEHPPPESWKTARSPSSPSSPAWARRSGAERP